MIKICRTKCNICSAPIRIKAGTLKKCRKCKAIYARNWRNKNKTRLKKYIKNYYLLNKSKFSVYVSRYNLKNKEKDMCHRRVSTSIRQGKLKSQPCEVCGNKKADAHHEDYSKPLDIKWVCRLHHMQIHRKY